MKAFISYSLTEQEQYIATLLSYRLREQGFSLILSNNRDQVDATTKYQVFLSDLFVGLVSLGSLQWTRVIEEYRLAFENNTLAILLIEQGVYIDPTFQGNYIIFNRQHLQDAIDEVRNILNANNIPKQRAAAWLLGGAAIVAFLALLADKGSRQ